MHLDLNPIRPVGPTDTDAWRDPLALMLASTGEGVFGVDMEGLCVFINPAGARMIGFEPQQVLGQNMHVLTHHSHGDGAHYPMDDCPIYNAFRRGEPCRIDSEVFWRADGSSFPVEYSSYPVFDQGQVRGAVVTFVDITERKRAEDALHQAKNELEARVTERTRALETALQQLRELAAWSEAVREEERTRIAREVHDELGSLLVALKMDVGWLDKRLSEQELKWCMEVNAQRVLPEPMSMAVFRIFQEMLSNVGRHARARMVDVDIVEREGWLHLSVEDDGCGAEAQVFESAQAYGIMGMRERARHFGGVIDIDSQPGRGTRILFSIPWPLRVVQEAP